MRREGQSMVVINWRVVLRRSLGAILAIALAIYLLAPWLPGGRPSRTVIVYGFSILGDVMSRGIFPAFQERWEREKGQHVEFVSAFAGSGTVTNQILLGVPAQVAILSLELDALRLEQGAMIPPGSWRKLPHQGVLNTTPFVILVRPGNPKRIRDFSDLTKAGVGVVHPDPLTSGGAQWAILAEYGGAQRQGRDAESELVGLWKNVIAQAASARAARTQYESGFGDALITYEQELLADRARGKLQGEIVYPPCTILSEHTVVVLDRNVAAADRELVDAFVEFLWSREAQKIFVERGFRSLDEELNRKIPVQHPFRVSDLGGWPRAKRDIIEGVWKARVLPELGR